MKGFGMDQVIVDFLEHQGIKGQKWGQSGGLDRIARIARRKPKKLPKKQEETVTPSSGSEIIDRIMKEKGHLNISQLRSN